MHRKNSTLQPVLAGVGRGVGLGLGMGSGHGKNLQLFEGSLLTKLPPSGHSNNVSSHSKVVSSTSTGGQAWNSQLLSGSLVTKVPLSHSSMSL